MFTKCKEVERPVNLKEKESAVEKKLKKCNQFSLGKLPAGKLFCKFNTTTKRLKLNPES